MIPQHLSVTQEHFTPSFVVEAARRTMRGIDLDPASCAEADKTVQAARYFTKEQDGLAVDWRPPFPDRLQRVFLNPPGGRTPVQWRKRFGTPSNATAWWRKLCQQIQIGYVNEFVFIGFTLEILRTSQGDNGWPSAMTYPFCVPRERLCFAGDDPTHANVIIYGGPNFDAFKREFSEIGEVKP